MATAIITPDQNAVIAEIFIAAPPARVFQAISDPTQLPRWWGQDGLYHVTRSTMDVRPGGKWRSDGVGADGKTFWVEGEYLKVDPPRLLVHTWVSSYDSAKTVVHWELEPQSVNALHPQRPEEIRHRNHGARSSGRICREHRIGHRTRRRLEACARLGWRLSC